MVGWYVLFVGVGCLLFDSLAVVLLTVVCRPSIVLFGWCFSLVCLLYVVRCSVLFVGVLCR